MFCYKCGQELEDNAKFCSKCGLKIVDDMLFKNCAKETSAATTATNFIGKIKKQFLKLFSTKGKEENAKGLGKALFATKGKAVIVGMIAITAVVCVGEAIVGSGNTASKYIKTADEISDEFMASLKDLAVSKIELDGIVNEATDEVKEFYRNFSDKAVGMEYELSDWKYEGYLFLSSNKTGNALEDSNYPNKMAIVYSCLVTSVSRTEIIFFPVWVEGIYKENDKLQYDDVHCERFLLGYGGSADSDTFMALRGSKYLFTCFNNICPSLDPDSYNVEVGGVLQTYVAQKTVVDGQSHRYIESLAELSDEFITSLEDQFIAIIQKDLKPVHHGDYDYDWQYEGSIFYKSKSLPETKYCDNYMYIVYSYMDFSGRRYCPVRIYNVYETNGEFCYSFDGGKEDSHAPGGVRICRDLSLVFESKYEHWNMDVSDVLQKYAE